MLKFNVVHIFAMIEQKSRKKRPEGIQDGSQLDSETGNEANPTDIGPGITERYEDA